MDRLIDRARNDLKCRKAVNHQHNNNITDRSKAVLLLLFIFSDVFKCIAGGLYIHSSFFFSIIVCSVIFVTIQIRT